MSDRAPTSREASPPPWRYVAGCGRSFASAERAEGGGAREAYAYTELEYPECPTCPHRLEPDDGPDFCVWRRADLGRPFAALEGWLDEESA